jgi:divalent metal cation (Fe/Co/Zn/Cd) transporter
MNGKTSRILEKNRYKYKVAAAVAMLAIVIYSALGYISVILGRQDDSFALLGFGIYAAAEVFSGIGIWEMIRRLRQNVAAKHEKIHKAALWVVFSVFSIGAVVIAAVALTGIRMSNRPETTFWSIIVALASISIPITFMTFMVKTGRELNSRELIAAGNIATPGLFASLALLMSGFGYEFLGIGLIDSLGAFAIALSCLAKGNSAFMRIRGLSTEGIALRPAVLTSFKQTKTRGTVA